MLDAEKSYLNNFLTKNLKFSINVVMEKIMQLLLDLVYDSMFMFDLKVV